MSLITIVLSYYNQPSDVLEKHLDSWLQFPIKIQKLFTFCIIDDSSKVAMTEIINFKNYNSLNLELYRIHDDLYCNIAGVRNLGAETCRTSHMLILDMDTLVDSIMAMQLVKLATNNMFNPCVFKFNRKCINPQHNKHHKIHPAICLIRKVDYYNIGGCEEDLVGNYGYTDPCFWLRAQGKVRVILMRDIYLNYLEEGESEIDRNSEPNSHIYAERKEKNNWSTNYLRFKWEKLEIK